MQVMQHMDSAMDAQERSAAHMELRALAAEVQNLQIADCLRNLASPLHDHHKAVRLFAQ